MVPGARPTLPLPRCHTEAAAPRRAALRAVAEPAASDGRLRRLAPRSALAAFGFTAGPLVDAVHNQALLSYDFLPLALPILGAKTSWIVPPLLAVAYALLGGVLPVAAERLIESGQLRGVPLGRACTAPFDFLAPGQRAALAVASTVGIIKLSEVLVVAALPTAATLAVLASCCVLQWLVLDGASIEPTRCRHPPSHRALLRRRRVGLARLGAARRLRRAPLRASHHEARRVALHRPRLLPAARDPGRRQR